MTASSLAGCSPCRPLSPCFLASCKSACQARLMAPSGTMRGIVYGGSKDLEPPQRKIFFHPLPPIWLEGTGALPGRNLEVRFLDRHWLKPRRPTESEAATLTHWRPCAESQASLISEAVRCPLPVKDVEPTLARSSTVHDHRKVRTAIFTEARCSAPDDAATGKAELTANDRRNDKRPYHH